jgi:hypothetical protein
MTKSTERAQSFGFSQKAQVLQALQAGRELTPLDALSYFGCFRLAARVAELRAEGHPIETTKTDGHAVYRLAA